MDLFRFYNRLAGFGGVHKKREGQRTAVNFFSLSKFVLPKATILLVLLLGCQAAKADWAVDDFVKLKHPLLRPGSIPFTPQWRRARHADWWANAVLKSFRQTYLTRNGHTIEGDVVSRYPKSQASLTAGALLQSNNWIEGDEFKFQVKGYLYVHTQDVAGSLPVQRPYQLAPVMQYGGQTYVVEGLGPERSGFTKLSDWDAIWRPRTGSTTESLSYHLIDLDADLDDTIRRLQSPPPIGAPDEELANVKRLYTLDSIAEQVRVKTYPENFDQFVESSNHFARQAYKDSAILYHDVLYRNHGVQFGHPIPGVADTFRHDDPEALRRINNALAQFSPTWNWVRGRRPCHTG